LASIIGFLVFYFIDILYSAYNITNEDEDSIIDWYNLSIGIIGFMLSSVALAGYLIKS
jgi:multisubunit Na+/H+ antiporter MnhB subunit